MTTTTTPVPLLEEIDRAGATLRAMRHTAERDDRYRDAGLERDLTAAIDALMRFRLKVQTPSSDPFPLLEETEEGTQLPTVSEWLRASAPMREVTPDDRQG